MYTSKIPLLQSVKDDRQGRHGPGYGLLAGLIAVVIIGAVQTLGTNMSTIFSNIATAMSGV